MRRFNPYWFKENGLPTENLLDIYQSLSRNLRERGFNNFSIYVVGSNARGNWRSIADIEKIIEITEKARRYSLPKKDLSFLRIFYTEHEITDYFFNPDYRYYLNPGRTYVSDLDLKIADIGIVNSLNLISELSYEKPGNKFWNGIVHVFISNNIAIPYFSFKKGWVFDDFF